MAICDGPHNPRFEDHLIVRAGLAKSPEQVTDALRSRVWIRAGGINHFNWLVEMTHAGRDVTPAVKASVRADAQSRTPPGEMHAIHVRTKRIAWQLTEALGYVPLCTGHTQEYVPYFGGHDVHKRGALAIRKWPVELRWKMMHGCWQDMRDIASGKRPVQDFLDKTTPDHASDIIEAMWNGLPKRFYINTCNRGAVTNMTDDAYLEIPCMVNMNAVQPLPFGPFPRPLLGFIQRVLDEHELAVEAAVTCDRNVLRQAFLASMVAVSIPDIEACMKDMLASERAYLPRAWFQ